MLKHERENDSWGRSHGSRADISGGFTLLELVMALSILAVVSVFAAGFLHPQIRLYYESDRRSKAQGMCNQAYRQLEMAVRYAYIFHVDPDRPERLVYYVREPGRDRSWDNGTTDENKYEKLPPVSRWSHISADDLDVDETGGMTVKMDFSGTRGRKADVLIQIMKDGEPVYEQEVAIYSMYDYEMEGEPEP